MNRFAKLALVSVVALNAVACFDGSGLDPVAPAADEPIMRAGTSASIEVRFNDPMELTQSAGNDIVRMGMLDLTQSSGHAETLKTLVMSIGWYGASDTVSSCTTRSVAADYDCVATAAPEMVGNSADRLLTFQMATLCPIPSGVTTTLKVECSFFAYNGSKTTTMIDFTPATAALSRTENGMAFKAVVQNTTRFHAVDR